MRLVGHLTAECDREVQGVARGPAEPGGEQRGGRGALAEAGQRYVVAVRVGVLAEGVEGIVGGPAVEVAVLVVRGGVGAQHVALAQQGARLDEAQRQPLGLEPEVARPVRLVLGERPLDDLFQQVDRGAAAQPGEEDLFEVRVGGGCRDVGCRGEQERALRRRLEQLLQRGPAELQVVEDDDGPDAPDLFEEGGAVGAQQRRVEDRLVEPVQQVSGGALVAGEPYDSVRCEVRTVGGDGVQQRGASGSGRSGEPHRAAARQQAHQPLALLRTLQERQLGEGGPGGTGGAAARSRSVRSAGVRRTEWRAAPPAGTARPRCRRPG